MKDMVVIKTHKANPDNLNVTLKFIALVVLPTLGTLFFLISLKWKIPEELDLISYIMFINLLLGLFLTFSKVRYDGTMEVVHQDDLKKFSLKLDSDPDNLDGKKEIVFKVKNIK